VSEATTKDALAVPRARTQDDATGGGLTSDKGTTTIDDGVVAKIAGLAAREVSGVFNMGAGAARALGTVRGLVGADKNATQGVAVEVGETQAAIDLDLVVEYGTAIPDLAGAVRKNVVSAVERMCGLEVTEVNIKIDDVHLPAGQEETEEKEPRVQ
jgi:uncharacterized alkaline shock family protein YloU